jgi:hypothetical protein
VRWRAIDLTERLGELAALPALIVCAAHDPIAPPSAGKALTHAPLVNGLLREHLAAIDARTA